MEIKIISIIWISSYKHTHTHTHTDFPGGLVVKNPPANEGDTGSIPGSGRSPGEGKVEGGRRGWGA